MKRTLSVAWLAAAGLLVDVPAAPAARSQTGSTAVTAIRLPHGGVQPHAAVDATGVVHVVYFSGTPAAGDLYYSRLQTGGAWAAPVRVNSQPASAIAAGTIRGARIAVGRDGRVHIAWNGSGRAEPKAPAGATPMLYARTNDAGTAFEPQRNLLQFAVGLDGGGAIAADSAGRVFVAWHAGGADNHDEGKRRVWLATSADDGRTFAREQPISQPETGACGCCGMDATTDAGGNLLVAYRGARNVVNRDSFLLSSRDAGRTFASMMLERWNIGACPMSAYDVHASGDAVLVAWETAGQVRFARVPSDGRTVRPVSPVGAGRSRRHPSLASAPDGRVLLSWSEGTAWERGGAAVWQLFAADGRALPSTGRADGVPVWGLTAAAYTPGLGFVVIY
jgi:hypothetical protein